MAHPGSPQYYRSPSPSRGYYPDNAPYDNYPKRSPSPSRGPPRQNYGRSYTRRVDPADYGHKRMNVDYESARGYGQGPDNLGGRKCCVAFLVGLVLLLLAGLAVGLYFAITQATESANANSPQKLVSNKGYNGYYVNGVYVVPVTTKPRDIYLIYGTDTPCHPFNNVTATNDPYPNCNKATTKIVLANWTTLKPVYLIPVGAGVSPTVSVGPLSTFVGLALAAALTWCAIGVQQQA